MTFSTGVRVERELRPADQPRRGRARQGLAGRQDARRPVAASWPTPARCSASCGRHPASSCCSWAASSATSRSGARSAAWTGACSTTRQHAGVHRLVRDLNGVYRATPALWTQDTTPAGFRWITARGLGAQHVLVPAAARPTATPVACVVNFAARPARELPHRPAAGRPLARDHQHRRAAVRRLRRRQPRRGPGRGHAVARPARLGRAAGAAAGRALAALRGLIRSGALVGQQAVEQVVGPLALDPGVRRRSPSRVKPAAPARAPRRCSGRRTPRTPCAAPPPGTAGRGRRGRLRSRTPGRGTRPRG